MEPQITSSIIQGACSIIAATIAAATAAVIGNKFTKISKLKENFEIAKDDIEFLLAVEEKHCNIHKQNSSHSNKNKIRDLVRTTNNISWSGQNTPGRRKNP